MPLVDVLMPLGALPVPLVQRAVASILGQSLADLRLFVIDDGASAPCLAWLEQLASADRRVKTIVTTTPGIVGALTAALAHGQAPLVARMDADDEATPWRLEQQVRLLQDRPQLDLVSSPVYLEGAAQAGWVRHVAWSNRLLTPEAHASERFVDAPVVHPTVLMRREAFERWGGYRQGPFAEDYELWLRAMASGAQLAKIAAPGLMWNRRTATLTASSSRYSPVAMLQLRARYLAQELGRRGGRFVVWGAGESGRRLLRELEAHGSVPESVYDIDPRKIGRTVRGHRVLSADQLGSSRPWRSGVTVVTAVAAPGARYLIGASLSEHGARMGADWLPAA